MSRIAHSVAWAFTLLAAVAACPAVCAQDGVASAGETAAGKNAPGAADRTADDGPPAMTEGQRSRWMEPPLGKFWPLFEIDKYDRALLGPEQGYEYVDTSIDIDFLMPIFGYRNQQRQAEGEWEAGEYGFSYAFPLWWNRWRPDRTDALLFPVAWHSRWRTGSRTVIPPALMTWGTDGDRSDFSILWPVMSVQQDGDSWRGRVAPLVWAGGDRDRTFAAIVPVLWYEKTTDHTTVLTPLGGHHSDRFFSYSMVTPAYHRWRQFGDMGKPRRGGDLALPVFLRLFEPGRSGWFALPGLLSLHDEAQGDVFVGGPAWGKSSADGSRGGWGVFPLLWRLYDEKQQKDSFLLLPLVHHRQDGADGETVVFPIVWDVRRPGQRHTHAWPIYGRDAWYGRDGEATFTRHSVAFPFFKVWHDYANSEWGWDAPFPVAGYKSTPQGSSAWLIPLAWYESTPEKWAFVAPALLTFGAGNATRSDIIQMPFYWHFRRGDQTTAVAPFTHYRHTGDRTTWSCVFPVTYGAWNDERWAFRFLWEGVAMEGAENDFRLRVLGGLFDLRMVEDEFMVELNPFFRYERKGDDYAYFSMFLGLYSYERQGASVSHAGFWSR